MPLCGAMVSRVQAFFVAFRMTIVSDEGADDEGTDVERADEECPPYIF